ncbi:MAG: AI-2E family transporter [Parcubacteria group bacterium]|nr:AI-2E family transporter [Parcubacteria group bacterium]
MRIMREDTTITISTETIFKTIFIGLLFVALYFLIDLVLVLLAAVVIASAIEPATRFLGRYRIPRVIAVLFMYATLTAVLFGILYFFLPPLLEDVSSFLAVLPEHVQKIENDLLGGERFANSIPGGLSLESAVNELRSALSVFSGGVVQTISSIFGGLFSFVLILVFSFYLAVQEQGIENFLRLITPIRHERRVINLWERTHMKIGRWMQGQLLLGLIVGILVYLGLMVIGVKYALLLAVLAAVFELIPLFGPILAAIPAVILAFLEGVPLGLMAVGLYVIIQQFENHLIYPLVVRKVVGVSPILVIVALVVGGELAGFLGLILAVPVAAALMELADDIQKGKAAQLEREAKKA